MTELLSRWQQPDALRRTQHITPQNAGWDYVGFSVYELLPGELLAIPADDKERCLVLLTGRATVKTSAQNFNHIGERQELFAKAKPKPWSVYVTAGDGVDVRAETALEIAVCEAPGKGTYPSRLIPPEMVQGELRGHGNNQRYVHNILPDSAQADSLLVVEVYTPEGCTSSYPSHKHDVDNPPYETRLEETYYHRLNPVQGFCLQRVYTDDRSLDEAMAVYNKDVVKVPKGYHPVATIAGYESYYLNVMAGPVREWRFSWEEAHRWINGEVYASQHADSPES